MLYKNKQCVDTGTVNCPCRLAGYGNCIVCSRLAGKDYCDCSWQGTCIYNEYLQNNRCIYLQRHNGIYRIEKITWYEKDLVVMRIAVPRGIAQKASLPGSFVFVKKPEADHFFDIPVSVLKSDYEHSFVELAVKINGPKTGSLAAGLRNGADVELRGIYRNGLLGADKLMMPGAKNVLCISKGMGLAPLVNYANWAAGRDSIDFIVDLEKISEEFAADYLNDCQVSSVIYRHLPLDIPWAQQEEYDAIVLSASDYYQQNIYIPDSRKVLSNNCSMCCGEGICGACIHTDQNGRQYRMCKCNNADK